MRLPLSAQTGCCSVCARPVEGLDGEYLCEECAGRHAPAYDRAACALRFEGCAGDMVKDFKFNLHLWLRDDFADLLEAAVRARFDAAAPDIVLPMPITAFHRWDRGCNQCEILGRALAKRLDRRFAAGVLRRRGHPARQSDLSEAERRENVKGTFAVRDPGLVRGRTVLVVDDILTTGSTLSEAASELKKSGAARVWGAVLARSVRD